MLTRTRITHDSLRNECLVGDKFKFIRTGDGVPSYFMGRLCEITDITLEREIRFFFYCEPLRDRKIYTQVFNSY